MAESSQDRLPRLLAMVPWLLQRPGVTLEKTAKHFGITIEQLTIDLYQLVVCGVPGYGPDQLVDIDFYDGERIWVTDPQTLNVPMRLTADELMAHSIALRYLSQLPGTTAKEEIGFLAAKLDGAASELGFPSVSSLLDVGEHPNLELEELIADGLARGVKISFKYSAADNSHTQRTVSPQRVFRVDDFLYLEAVCDQAEAMRLFRLDRIGSACLSDEVMTNVSDFHADSISSPTNPLVLGPSDSAQRATLRLFDAALWLSEEDWVETDPAEPGVIRVPFLNPDWLFRWVLSLGPDVTLLEPPEVAERVSRAIHSGLSRLQAGE